MAAGHRIVAEWWEIGPGELPQLLWQLKSATTPTPTPAMTTPTKEKESEAPMEEDVDEAVAVI